MCILNNLDRNKLIQQCSNKSEELERHLQEHRLAIIGRLTSNIVHEINNPMQAIRGGAALALEEIDDPASVSEYLRLIQRESDRVLALTALLRSLYSSKENSVKVINIGILLDELLALVKDDLNQKGLQLKVNQAEKPLLVTAVENHVQLAVIELLLNINQILSGLGRKTYSLNLHTASSDAVIELVLDVPVSITLDGTNDQGSTARNSIDSSLINKLFQYQDGKISLETKDQQSTIRLEYPLTAVAGGEEEEIGE